MLERSCLISARRTLRAPKKKRGRARQPKNCDTTLTNNILKLHTQTSNGSQDGKKRSRESQPLQTITNGNVPLPAPTTRLRSASSSAQIAAARSAANATMQAHRRSATTRTASTAAAHTPPPESLAFPFYVHDPLVPVDYMDEIDRTCHSKQLIHAPNRYEFSKFSPKKEQPWPDGSALPHARSCLHLQT